jgi:hypothetical protein
MTGPFDSSSSRPLYNAIPVLEGADDAAVDIVDALPVRNQIPLAEPAPIILLPADKQPIGIVDVVPVPAPAFQFFRPKNPVLLVMWFAVRVVIWLFGAVCLMFGLAILAALPVIQFLSLGYLLEAGGRVARTGRLRNGFIGIYRSALLGIIVVGSWLLLWPMRIVSGLTQSADIIDPGGRTATGWRIGLFASIGLTTLVFAVIGVGALVIVAAIRRRTRPDAGTYYAEARDAVWDLVMSLRLPYYFWLGCRGFVGAMAWLVVPVSLIALGRVNTPLAPLIGFFGAFLLAIVLIYLPILQMRLAQTNRLRAVFEFGAAREAYKRAPWAATFAIIITLLFALPLYLLKIEIVPREAEWLPSLVFITFIFPARLLTGWALGRANRRQTPRHWFFRWTGRLPLLPATAIYVVIVFFTQYTSWNGVWSLYEQHAFLVPVPFFGM